MVSVRSVTSLSLLFYYCQEVLPVLDHVLKCLFVHYINHTVCYDTFFYFVSFLCPSRPSVISSLSFVFSDPQSPLLSGKICLISLGSMLDCRLTSGFISLLCLVILWLPFSKKSSFPYGRSRFGVSVFVRTEQPCRRSSGTSSFRLIQSSHSPPTLPLSSTETVGTIPKTENKTYFTFLWPFINRLLIVLTWI